ncbi:MAG: transporter [Pirellulales bacterium]|nr:transporter [Pirellulales bacterium]
MLDSRPIDSLKTVLGCGLLLFCMALPAAVSAQESYEDVEIKDNSFLIEEAYNQEKGIIQHIFNWVPSWDVNRGVRHRESNFLFTQEWPVFSQKHQFSYSIPIGRMTDQAPGGPIYETEGIGDILLNYRYQLLGGAGQELSIAPRFSLALPSGDENLGLGTGKLGYQFLVPVSKEYERWCFHFNAGILVTPDVTAGADPLLALPGQTLNGYNLGGSAIYKFMPNCHLMLETLAVWDENLLLEGTRDRNLEWVISPGFRWAPYTRNDVQWVLGVAAPIGLNRNAPDASLFFYMSFEHPFTIAPQPPER